jgi:hypothetical protein
MLLLSIDGFNGWLGQARWRFGCSWPTKAEAESTTVEQGDGRREMKNKISREW